MILIKAKKNMAESYSLKELAQEYSELKVKVADTKKDLPNLQSSFDKINDDLSAIEKDIENLEKRKNSIQTIRDTYEENTPEYNDYDERFKKVSEELEKAKLDKADKQQSFNDISSKLNDTRNNFSNYESRLKEIITIVVQDPTINSAFKKIFESEYNKRIEEQQNLINNTKTQRTNLTNSLKDNPTLANLVSKLKEAYAEKIKYSAYSTEATKVNSAYNKAAKDLRKAIKDIDEFKDIKLTDEDLNSIMFDKPILEEKIQAQEDIKKALEEQKNKILEFIENAKVISKENKDKIKAKEDEISENNRLQKENANALKELKDKISNLGYDFETLDLEAEIKKLEEETEKELKGLTREEKNELADLENRVYTNENDSRVQKFNGAKNGYNEIFESFKEDDYIPDEALKLLGDENVNNLYKDFFEADRALRREFLDIKGKQELFVVSNKNAREKLDNLIKEYQEKADKLSKTTGFSVAALHDYLQRDILDRIDNKEDGFEKVPEEYQTNLSSMRVKDYSKVSKDKQVKEMVNRIKNLENSEELILAGKDNAVDNYNKDLSEYIDYYTSSLDMELKSNILNAIVGSFTIRTKGLFGLIKKLFNKGINTIKRKFKPSLRDKPDGINVKLDLFDEAKNKLEEARKEMENASNLTPEEKERYKSLKNKKNEIEAEMEAFEDKKIKLDALKNFSDISKKGIELKEKEENLRKELEDESDKTFESRIKDSDAGLISERSNSQVKELIDDTLKDLDER